MSQVPTILLPVDGVGEGLSRVVERRYGGEQVSEGSGGHGADGSPGHSAGPTLLPPEPRGGSVQLFISYARVDKAVADHLAADAVALSGTSRSTTVT